MNRTPFAARRLALASVAVVAAAASLAALPSSALAYDEQSSSEINVDANGVALKGYDPVSYFKGRPARGRETYTAVHGGAIYRFASSSNRDEFRAQPEQYEPRFGGYCAMGVALNKKLDVDPQLWRIVDGRLYLNVSKPAQQRWLSDVPGNIGEADKNWPRIKGMAPTAL